MTQVGAPAVGEVLADRYRLEEHIQDDSTGRQIWCGVDVILRRRVNITLKCPGGSAAEEMLQAAVAASRVVHPHTVGVYDAVDEGERAYVVREWVDGRSLADIVAEGPLDPARATAVAHAVADALAAVHQTGVAHGNVHAGTVLLADDRVVLGDASAGPDASPEGDIRALGGVLYCALTAEWPQEVPGPVQLPPAPRLDGKLASPRQIRGGVPSYLDALTMDLLDPTLPPPAAAELAAELGRLDMANEVGTNTGPLDLVTVPPPNGRPGGFRPTGRSGLEVWQKFAIAIAALVVLSLVGLLLLTNWAPGSGSQGEPSAGPSSSANHGAPTPIKVAAARLVDPDGDGQDPTNVSLAIDGNPQTGWHPDYYNSPDFGKLKKGMGILLDLGAEHSIATVQVDFKEAGTTVQLYTGNTDPGGGKQSKQADNAILTSFTAQGQKQSTGTQWLVQPSGKARYLLVWITSMPARSDGSTYQTTVNEVTVRGQ